MPVMLDGDSVRDAIRDENCGHDPASRLVNAYRISRLANLMAEQGHLVIVATMSLFHEIQNWNRQNISGYFEIFMDVSLANAMERDKKNIYSGEANVSGENVPGIDIVPEFPLNPDLRIDNNREIERLGEYVDQIIRRIKQKREFTMGIGNNTGS